MIETSLCFELLGANLPIQPEYGSIACELGPTTFQDFRQNFEFFGEGSSQFQSFSVVQNYRKRLVEVSLSKLSLLLAFLSKWYNRRCDFIGHLPLLQG